MNQKERMEEGLPYKIWEDGLDKERIKVKKLLKKYNDCSPGRIKKRKKIIKRIVNHRGENIHIESPFYCDYGYNIEIGENFYSNHNLIILDVGKITIGENVMMGPGVILSGAGHPIHHQSRNSGYEYGAPITIGDNVWIGGAVVINPGVKIGENTVIGAGAVVTKDIPANVIAAGVPARVIKEITDEDRKYYYKDKEFDVTDY